MAAETNARAVPDGASFFMRWCISITSRSNAAPRISAACPTSSANTAAPSEVLGATSTGICCAKATICSTCSGVWLVVATVTGTLCLAHASTTCRETSGVENSITTLHPASCSRSFEYSTSLPTTCVPSLVDVGETIAACSTQLFDNSNASITFEPVLPVAPTTPIFFIA